MERSQNKRKQKYKKNNGAYKESMKTTRVCADKSCTSNHAQQIDTYLGSLMKAIKQSSEHFTNTNENKFKAVPGWNKVCKKKYEDARIMFFK